MKKLHYKNRKGKNVYVTLPDDVYHQWKDATEKFETSRAYVFEYVYDIWNQSIKDYMMFTGDRASKIKAWQSNVALGLVRSTVDSYQSFLYENPFSFNATGLNELGFQNREFATDAVNYVADVTKFRPRINDTMVEGLILGNYCFKTVYLKSPKKKKSIEIVDGIPMDVEFTYDINDVPYTFGIDPYKMFPDPYNGKLRYVTERDVVSTKEFIRLFGNLIKSKDNLSPLNSDEFIESLALNKENADFQDYGRVRTEIFKHFNDLAKANDTLPKLNYGQTRQPSYTTPDEDPSVTANLVEYKLTVDDNRWTLDVNGYPAYVGRNPYGFMNYEWGNAYHTMGRYSEGLPLLLRGYEEIGTSFMNAYVDGAKSLIHPNFIADRNLIINPRQAENAGPGDVIWTDGPAGNDAFRRVEKWSISDFWMVEILQSRGQQISGVSDYNSGVSARERVATAVAALVESTNRRIAGYVKRFSYSLGNVAETWLYFMQKYWTAEQWTYVVQDGQQIPKNLSNSKLKGAFHVTLAPETFLGVSKESEIKRSTELFNVLSPTGIINSSEWAKDMIRSFGKNPAKFIADENVVIPANKQQQLPSSEEPAYESTVTDESVTMSQDMNPQTDLWNEGEGQA